MQAPKPTIGSPIALSVTKKSGRDADAHQSAHASPTATIIILCKARNVVVSTRPGSLAALGMTMLAILIAPAPVAAPTPVPHRTLPPPDPSREPATFHPAEGR